MIIPVIFEEKSEEIERKVKLVDSVAHLIQIDFADGKLVDGKTFLDADKLEKIDTTANFELHLMVVNPLDYVAGKIEKVTRVCSQIDAFYDSTEEKPNVSDQKVRQFIDKAKSLGYKVGLSISTETPLDVVKPYISDIDYFQFVSVVPGGQSRKFIPKVLEKIVEFKKLYPNVRVQVDGGIYGGNIQSILKAGANDVVIGSDIFDSVSPIEEAIALGETMEESQKKVKKIAFLGGASIQPDDPTYENSYQTARLLAQNGYEIINGGGSGIMRAATQGARDGHGRVLAVTYHPNKPKLHYEGRDPLNQYDEEVITLDYFDRTKVILQNSDVHIVFNGSLGTISEFGMTWVSSWIHEPDFKPIILFGEPWKHIIAAIKEYMLIHHEEDHLLKFCLTPQEVLDYVKSLG